MQSPEALTRTNVEPLDAILGQPFDVLDQGFIRVVDYMGSDGAIVQAARVSYGEGTKKVREDRGLIRYLMRHRHTTPFEMCEIKFHVRVPMDCWRQWIRHRTASVNEYSTRYSVAIDAMQATPADGWRTQSTKSRQGSEGYLEGVNGALLSDNETKLHERLRAVYEERLDAGVAREQARKDLPLSTYTEAYWKIDLHNLLHFLQLRMDEHAQKEIREYAATIGHEVVARWVPLTWEAFCDYRLGATVFSQFEHELLADLASGRLEQARERASDLGWLGVGSGGQLRRHRERQEFEAKLNALGLVAPWLSDRATSN